jgi:nicotinamidase/pyrazinamidase
MKKALVTLAIAAALLFAACVGCAALYFHSAGEVSAGEKIAPGRADTPALLVVDIQEGITGPAASKLTQAMARQSGPFIAKVNSMIAFARGKNMPVIYIRQENGNKLFNALTHDFLAPGTPGAALDKRVTVVAGPVFTKGKMDAFSNPAFEAFLKDNAVNHLYVTGLSASACVDRTVRAALNRGYAVTAVIDAIIADNVKDKEEKCREWAREHAELAEAERFQ